MTKGKVVEVREYLLPVSMRRGTIVIDVKQTEIIRYKQVPHAAYKFLLAANTTINDIISLYNPGCATCSSL